MGPLCRSRAICQSYFFTETALVDRLCRSGRTTPPEGADTFLVAGRRRGDGNKQGGSDDTKRDRPGGNPGTRCSCASVAAWVSGARGSYRRFNRSIWVGNARIFLISSQLHPPVSTPVADACAHAAPKPVPGDSLSRRHARRPDLDEGNSGVLGLSCLPWAAKTP